MKDQRYHHNPDMGTKDPSWEDMGNGGEIPMIKHVVSLLSALVCIIGIINDNLGKRK